MTRVIIFYHTFRHFLIKDFELFIIIDFTLITVEQLQRLPSKGTVQLFEYFPILSGTDGFFFWKPLEAKSLVCVSEVLYWDSTVGKSYIFVVDIKWGYLVFMSQCSLPSVWVCPQYVADLS